MVPDDTYLPPCTKVEDGTKDLDMEVQVGNGHLCTRVLVGSLRPCTKHHESISLYGTSSLVVRRSLLVSVVAVVEGRLGKVHSPRSRDRVLVGVLEVGMATGTVVD